MGRKIKNRKKIKNIIPAAINSEEQWEVLEAHILKLEGQLHEIKVQKEAEITTTLETGRKEGYILGCQEQLEAVRQVVDIGGGASHQLSTSFTSNANTTSNPILPIPSSVRKPHKITILQLDLQNPWGSLSWRHHCSHPCKPSASICHLFCYTTDNCKHIPLVPSSSAETTKIVWHAYGIQSAKPIVRAPIMNSFVASPIHHTPLIPESITQSPHINFFHYILSKFIPGIVSYSLSVSHSSWFYFGGNEGVTLWGGTLVLGSRGCGLCLAMFGPFHQYSVGFHV